MFNTRSLAFYALALFTGAQAFAAPPSGADQGDRTPAQVMPAAINGAFGALLPSNGGEGIEQTENSLPRAFADGTAPQLQGAIMARYFRDRAYRAGRGMLAQK